MKSFNKSILALIIVIFSFTSSAAMAADALVWGYFTDNNFEFIDGLVDAVSCDYQSDSSATAGYYMLYLPAGNYTFTATADGHETETVQLTVANDETYQLDFALNPTP